MKYLLILILILLSSCISSNANKNVGYTQSECEIHCANKKVLKTSKDFACCSTASPKSDSDRNLDTHISIRIIFVCIIFGFIYYFYLKKNTFN